MGLAAVSAFLYFLPALANVRLAPFLAKIPGIEHVSCDIRKVDPFGLDLAGIHAGSKSKDAVSIETARIEFSPAGIAKRSVKRLVLGGVTLSGQWDGHTFHLPGIDWNQWGGGEEEHSSSGNFSRALFGFSLASVEIVNGLLEIDWLGKPVHIPFNATVDLIDLEKMAMEFSGSLLPLGQRITVSGKTGDIRNGIELRLRARGVPPNRFTDLLSKTVDADLKGAIDLTVRGAVLFEPVRVDDVFCEVLWSGMRVELPGMSLFEDLSGSEPPQPPRITLVGGSNALWEAQVSGFTIDSGAEVRVRNLHLSLAPVAEGLAVAGNFTLAAPTGNVGEIFLRSPFQLPLQFTAKVAEDGTWEGQLGKSTGDDVILEFSAAGTSQRSAVTAFSFSAFGDRLQGQSEIRIKTTGTRIETDDAVTNIPEIELNGECRFGLESLFSTWDGAFALALASPRFKTHDLTVSVPGAKIQGSMVKADGKEPSVSTVLRFAGGAVRGADRKFEITGINGSVPFHWPAQRGAKGGKISVASIRAANRSLGSASMDFRQIDSGISIGGRYRSDLLEGLSFLFSGTAKWNPVSGFTSRIEIGNESPPYRFDIDLGRFAPAAEGIRIAGQFAGSGQLNWAAAGPGGSVSIRLKDTVVEAADGNAVIEGIDTTLTVPDLTVLRSAAMQKLSFGSARIGHLAFTNGEIDYQVEKSRTLFIEKAGFRWCGGNVDAHAMRISPDTDDYRLILYCDRLLLSEILAQVGNIRSEGKGAVNGKIPIRFANGRLSFDDGFLYSTPGDGGTIRLSGTEMLTAGIPSNTLQYAQLELARAALSDYRYQWAKLGLNTEGESLILRLQMDGKPANPLPFVYKKELGGFAKVEADSKGSIFQGISLDVNFNLPLDKILQYQDIFKQME